MKSFIEDRTITFFLIFSVFLLLLSIVIAAYNPQPSTILTIFIILLSQLATCILFPLLVGYYMERYREKRDGDTLMQYFDELSEGGIMRVFKHRKPGSQGFEDMKRKFETHTEGEIKIIGVTLKTFFSSYGLILTHIQNSLTKYPNIKIKALLCDEKSPELNNRGEIENSMDGQINMQNKILTITKEIDKLINERKLTNLSYRKYMEAPYCTAVIFPDMCYFSPNILSKSDSINLPFFVLKKGSEGYEKIDKYFDYLWEKNKPKVKYDVN